MRHRPPGHGEVTVAELAVHRGVPAGWDGRRDVQVFEFDG
jgi:hypothetical protein